MMWLYKKAGFQFLRDFSLNIQNPKIQKNPRCYTAGVFCERVVWKEER